MLQYRHYSNSDTNLSGKLYFSITLHLPLLTNKKGGNSHKSTIALKVAKYIKGHITGWKKDVLKFPFLHILSNTATSAKLSVTGHKLRSLGRLAGHRQGKAWELAEHSDGTSPEREQELTQLQLRKPVLWVWALRRHWNPHVPSKNRENDWFSQTTTALSGVETYGSRYHFLLKSQQTKLQELITT